MAIAEAVLDVIKDEGLQQNAKVLGEYLMENLLAMKEKYDFIGDVRGVGLFIGIDIVKDRDSREPDEEFAKRIKFRYTLKIQCMYKRHVVYRMLCDHKVIIHVDGVKASVIKIKPPLVLTKEDCTYLLQALDSCFSTIQSRRPDPLPDSETNF